MRAAAAGVLLAAGAVAVWLAAAAPRPVRLARRGLDALARVCDPGGRR